MNSRKARIAVVGAGYWAVQNHIPLLKQDPEVELAAICTLGADTLAKLQHAFDIPYGTESYAELLDRIQLDGVVVSSPHVCHFEHAKAAIAKNCNVLLEKPFTTDAGQARELVRLEREHGVNIVMPLGYNFSKAAQSAAEKIKSGLLGDIRHAVLHMASATATLFQGERVAWASNSLIEPSPSTWADPNRAGGFGWGQLSHALGLLFLLIDCAAESVFAMTGNTRSGTDLFDAAALRLVNGATVAISGSSGLAPHARPQLDLRIFGTKGHLAVDFEHERVELHTSAGESLKSALPAGSGVYSCKAPVKLFVDVCLGRAVANPATGMIGCRSTEVLDAFYRSAASQRVERV
jgi:predicted dehydrogenase